ncbi:MAG: hypothetical protein ACXVGH_06860 [Mycobacteriales bacterium]
MHTALLVALLLLAVWLTFFPMLDATKRDVPPWPWIVGGLVAGPLSGLVYLMVRRSLRMVAERDSAAS